MMETQSDENFIISNSGEVRGRRNLVQEILRLASKGNLENINSINGEFHRIYTEGTKDESSKHENNDKEESVKSKTSLVKSTCESRPISSNISLSKNDIASSYNLNFMKYFPKKTLQENETMVSTTYIESSSNESISSFDSKTHFKFLKGDFTSLSSLSKPEQTETDFGYYDYKKSFKKPFDSLSFNFQDKERSLQLPDLYLYEYDKDRGKMESSSSWKQWNYDDIDKLNDDSSDNCLDDTCKESKDYLNDNYQENHKDCANDGSGNLNPKLSRNSSLHSYSRILPVGKFATQKFHIVQDEEELVDCPNIQDLNGTPICNLEYTKEFDCIAESVTIDICNLISVKVNINITVNKYSKKNQLEKPWNKKRIDISRTIDLDLKRSGQVEKMETLLNEVKKGDTGTISFRPSVYRLTYDQLQLSGQAAFKVFQAIMDIAENEESSKLSCSEKKRNQFTPKYLLAALPNFNSLYF